MKKSKKKSPPPQKRTGGAARAVGKPCKSKVKINVRALIDALEQHVLGEKEMTATQVNAALSLLKKTLPDISESARKSKGEKKTHEDALELLD